VSISTNSLLRRMGRLQNVLWIVSLNSISRTISYSSRLWRRSELGYHHHIAKLLSRPLRLHGPEQIATRGRLNSPPEAGSNRHLRPVNSPPPGW